MARSANRHFDRWYGLRALRASSLAHIKDVHTKYEAVDLAIEQEDSARWKATPARVEQQRLMRQRMLYSLDEQEAARALASYPTSPADVMPTSLGNVLRRYETQARDYFGLDPIVAMPYVALLAEDNVRSYLDDQRSGMDLAVRLTLVWAMCAAIGVGFLWRYDTWLLVPGVAYGLAVLSYRGAARAAMFYGSAMTVTLTLTRRALWDRLGVSPPSNSKAEETLNGEITDWLSGGKPLLRYKPAP
jgi:hypothetical protein